MRNRPFGGPATFGHLCYLATALLLSISGVQCLPARNSSLPKECYNHELIKPMIVIGHQAVPLALHSSCPDKLKIQFSCFGGRFVMDLVKNTRLISDRYFENLNRHSRHPGASLRDATGLHDDQFHKNHMFLNLNNLTKIDAHCHYHGYVNGDLNSISAISVVGSKLLTGFFHDGSHSYHLNANTTNSTTIVTKYINMCDRFKSNTQANNVPFSLLPLIGDSASPRRLSREAASKGRSHPTSLSENIPSQGPFASNTSSLFVELLIVHDHSQYVEYKGNASNIAERTLQIVNIMNAFYRQLNIFIALVGVVLWKDKDEIQLTDDGDSTLTNFLKYRYEKLLPRYHHDNAQLITSTSFNGSVVGKALKGPICTHEHSGGVNTDHSHSPAIVAVTLAHELGHNFGMEHDEEDKCRCPDEKCIMSSSSSAVHPKHWSSCSHEYLEEARKHGLLDCLIEQPAKIFGPICGNGFVEDGEDCDLGEPVPLYGSSKSRKAVQRCARGHLDCDPDPLTNPCCDRQTCKFVANATCAQGACCDLTRCAVYNGTETRVCRPRQTECDLEEICDGSSELCPPDVYFHDGLECDPTASKAGKHLAVNSAGHNRSRAYCYKGKCTSHESQCQLLWGPSGSASRDMCYEQNVHGNTSGNCGYNRQAKQYETCQPENAICGMLHCVHSQPGVGDSRKTGKLGYGFESASILMVSFFVLGDQEHTRIFCHGAIIDAGPSVRDPGLVPNGAACGDERMCLEQKCVPVDEVLYKNWCPSDCSGNGVCDNLGVCHCFDGTVGTSCYQFFGANFHLSLLLYMVMFFIPMIALIVFTINHYRKQIKIWWFLHNRKIALRNKAREPSQPRRAHLQRAQLIISEPIPLSQHGNTNRPFYEPPLDPWTESSCAGYRLEPLSRPAPALASHHAPAVQVSTLKPVRAAPPPPISSRGPPR